MWSGKNFPRNMIFNGSNQRGFAAGSLQYGFDEERSRALPVRAGDSTISNSFGGTFVEIRTEASEGAPSMQDLRPSHCGTRHLGCGVTDYGNRSGRDSLINKAITVASLALHRDKDAPGPHSAGIIFHTSNAWVPIL